ncbi:hypothetical protein ACFJIX_06610 [Roseateles sp. UC29_93]|uniref:hypothetical protein n=1 Tax=Roseateles sp. UC29_93 TaxID=3350177 RepID=UPI00366D5CF0
MKKQWMAITLSAGLCQLAMADVKVTLQGELAGGWKTIDCPATADVCADNPIALDATPFTLTFTFKEGLSPGPPPRQ